MRIAFIFLTGFVVGCGSEKQGPSKVAIEGRVTLPSGQSPKGTYVIQLSPAGIKAAESLTVSVTGSNNTFAKQGFPGEYHAKAFMPVLGSGSGTASAGGAPKQLRIIPTKITVPEGGVKDLSFKLQAQ